MKTFVYALSHVLIACLILATERQVSAAERRYLKIVRNTDFADDSLEVPSTKCVSRSYCEPYNAIKNVNNCSCFCGRDKSTFYESLWKCVDNQEVREKEKCDMFFKDEKATDPLKVLTNEGNVGPSLIPFNTSIMECKIIFGEKLTSLMGCNGTWESLKSQYVERAFSYKPEWSRKSIAMKVSKVTEEISLIKGKLIKLVVQCRLQSSGALLNNSCVLLKVKGTSQCCSPGFNCEDAGSSSSTTLTPTTGKTTEGTRFTTPLTEKLNNDVLDGTKKPSSKPSRESADNRILGFIFGVGIAVVVIVTVIITFYIRDKKRKRRKRDALVINIRVPKVYEGLNYDQPIIPHATDKSCFGNPMYQRGEDKSIVIKNGKIDTKSLLNRNLQLSVRYLAEQSSKNMELTKAKEEPVITKPPESTTNTDFLPEKKQAEVRQYEVPAQSSTDNIHTSKVVSVELYNISPYCVTYFGKNARKKQLRDSNEKREPKNHYEEPGGMIAEEHDNEGLNSSEE